MSRNRETIVIQFKQEDDPYWSDWGECELKIGVSEQNTTFQAFQFASNLKDQFDYTRVVKRTYLYTYQDVEIEQ